MSQEILQQIALLEQQLSTLKQLVENGIDKPQTNSQTNSLTAVTLPSSLEHSPDLSGSPESLLVVLFQIILERDQRLQEASSDSLERPAQSIQDAIDDELLHAALSPLLHSNITANERSLQGFFRFHWKTFEQRFKDYLDQEADPSSFDVVRVQSNHRAELSEHRLYLAAKHRSPTPIVFKQDPVCDRDWRISTLSL